jgi:hypothetical protein
MIYDEYSREEHEVDVLFFEVGEALYGTDASTVLRIERALPDDLTIAELGSLKRGNRALVFETSEGEGHLKVDAIRGVRPVPIVALRRLPPAASAASYTVGVFLDEERPVLLIDLVETLNSQGRH